MKQTKISILWGILALVICFTLMGDNSEWFKAMNEGVARATGTYTIKYAGNTVTTGTMANTVCNVDQWYKLSKHAYVNSTGRYFAYWEAKINGKYVYFQDEAEVCNLIPAGSTITLKAIYENSPSINQANGYYDKYVYFTFSRNGATSGYMPITDIGFSSYKTNSSYVGTTETKTVTMPSCGYTRTGYTFQGWNVGGTVYNAGATYSYKFTYDKSYYSRINIPVVPTWKANTYTVTYHANGGSGSMANSTATYDSNFTTRQNAFTRPGYTFKGWNEKADGTGASWTLGSAGVYESGKTWKWTYAKNITLYAQWEPKIYTVTLDPQEASDVGTKTYYEKYGDANYRDSSASEVVSGITIPKKTGHKFGGYYSGKNGTGTQYVNESGSILSRPTDFTADTTLYAYWMINNYNLSYDPNEGEGEEITETYSYGEDYTIKDSDTFSRQGYYFEGWNDKADGNGTNYIPGDCQKWTIEGDVTLYAQWKPIIYKITLDGQSANLEGTTCFYIKYNTGIFSSDTGSETISNITTPVKTGYTFCGYYTEKNGEGEQYVDASGSILCDSKSVLENTTLYAYWTINSYWITYDANGGTGTVASTPAIYDVSVNLAENTFRRRGYTFRGWSTTANGSVTYGDKERVVNLTTEANVSITLYAVWEANRYTITLDSQGATSDGTRVYYEKYDSGLYSDENCNHELSNIVVPQRTGYTFKGYYTGKEGTGTCYINEAGTMTADKTSFVEDTELYAYWVINKYTIRYDANGGSGAMTDSLAVYGVSLELTGNEFSRTGHTFKGWAISANESVIYKDKQLILNLTQEAGKIITLYAVWEPNIYAIILDSQNAETVGTTIYYEKYNKGNFTTKDCTTEIRNITIPAKTGYTFQGYYTDKNGIGTQYINALGMLVAEDTACSADQTLYAYWTINTYKIQYHANGGSGTMTDTSAMYGKSVSLGENIFVRTGYTFKGWSTSAAGAVIYSDKASVVNLTKENGAIIHLYAVWDVNSYEITYNANGGTSLVTSKRYDYGTLVDLGITAEKQGYKFIGWSPLKTARIPLPFYIMENQNITLYAVYTISVSDVENHSYPSYLETSGITEDEVFLKVWLKGDASLVKTYSLTYIKDTNPMVYRYELPVTDISSFVNGRKFYYQLIAYDNAGNYAVLQAGGSDGTEIPDTEEIPKTFEEYLQTVKHYKYKATTNTWEWFDTTTEKVKEGITYQPSYIKAPMGYYASHKDNESVVFSSKIYCAYYKPYVYTLTFDAGKGTCGIVSKPVTYGDYYGVLPIPERKGYTFCEWNTEVNGTGEKVSGGDIYEISSDSTIYAQWKPNVYTIILDGMDAEIAGTRAYYEKYDTGNFTTKDCVVSISRITTPGKTGYTFKGYYTETEGKGTCYIDADGNIRADSDTFSADTTLYAYWEANTYTLAFHANGGRGVMDNVMTIYGEKTTLPYNSYVKTGYRFMGWALSASGDVIYEDRQTVINLSEEDGETINLYAVWSPMVYAVKFDHQGAENAGTESYYQKYDKGNYTTKECNTVITSVIKPVKTGYTFKGYYFEKNGKGTQYVDALGEILATNKTFTSDTILYAYWTENRYTIKYDSNGGEGSMENTSAQYNETVVLRSSAFRKMGYVFKGWSTSSAGSVKYSDKATVRNLATENGNVVTLYALWEPLIYTIKLDCDEGDTAGTLVYYQKYDNGNYKTEACLQAISTIIKPTKIGYSFGGYFTGKDGTGIQYVDAKGVILSTKTTFIDDITLYAKWTPNAYTIQYHANEGSGVMEDTTAIYNEFVTLRTNSFTRTGYEFMGWATSPGGKVLYENNAMIKNASSMNDDLVSLYAVWEPVVFKITLDHQDATMVGTVTYYEKYDIANYITADCTTSISVITKPEKTGYLFLGYYSGKNGTGIQYVDDAGRILSTSTTFTEHRTLYAYWIPISYTIQYQPNTGSGEMVDTPATYDVPVTLPVNLFCKTGYRFKGWSKTMNGSVEYQDRAEVKNLTTDSGGVVTLYAVWEANPYTVTYDYSTNGGNYVSINSQSFDYGTEIDLTVTAKKDNYTFVGWNTDSTAIAGLTSLTMGAEPITLYAIFKKDITVTFVEYGNGGMSTWIQTKTVYNNGTHADFSVEERKNWTGWKNIGWTNETSALADSKIATGANYTTDKNETLYARYHSEVKLSYDTNGSTMKIDSVKKDCYYNASGDSAYPQYMIANAPILQGYAFVNWKLEYGCIQDEFGNLITFTKPKENICVLQDSLLKAVWDRHPVIEAYNRHFTLEEAKSGIITEEELLKKVFARDEEAKTVSNPEGILENGVDVIVKNYNASDFTSVTSGKEIPVTYQAKDSFGNIVTKLVTITITDTSTKKSNKHSYVRFISRNYLVNDSGDLLSYSQGGLEETSIWRTNTLYGELLRETVLNTKTDVLRKTVSAFGQTWEIEVAGSGKWIKQEETWLFTRKDIREMKHFTLEFGHMRNAIQEFLSLFQGCKQTI